jgi:hypothetical protein
MMGWCDPRGVCRLGAACMGLAAIAQSPQVRQAQHAALFGRAGPPPLGRAVQVYPRLTPG